MIGVTMKFRYGTPRKQEIKSVLVNRILPTFNRLPSPVLCAWTAGIVDGEGYVGIAFNASPKSENNRHFKIVVRVCNTDLAMMDKLLRTWGGTLTYQNKDNTKYLDLYAWALSNKAAYRVLTTVLPYLVTKKERAKICIEMQKRIMLTSRVGRSLLDEELKIRAELYNKCKKLSAVGKNKIPGGIGLIEFISETVN